MYFCNLTFINVCFLEINFFFACCGLIFSIFYCFILTDEYTQFFKNCSDPENGLFFIVLCTISGVFGIIITLSVLCVVAIGGPIAVNISGTFKDVFLTYVGFMFFDD